MSIFEIFVLAFTAIIAENFVLSQFLGCCPFLGVSKKVETANGMGMAVTFVMALASLFTYFGQQLLVKINAEYLQTILFILIIAALVQFVEMFLQKMVPALYESLGIYLPLITTNCAVLGVAILNVQKESGLFESVLYGAFSGVGFWLAIVLLAGVRERIDTNDCPACYKGFPLTLTAAALIALAFSGLSGIKL
ncbi:MAG: RnfABCDGE type electron transport complex subunit A [Clostridia bacterium]|nr:RnfABCDGE type electron transport complex subunit A [Clostridia bacterium]